MWNSFHTLIQHKNLVKLNYHRNNLKGKSTTPLKIIFGCAFLKVVPSWTWGFYFLSSISALSVEFFKHCVDLTITISEVLSFFLLFLFWHWSPFFTGILQLESNLRRLALSAEWLKHVDSVATVGSASHVVTSSKYRKRTRYSDLEPKPLSKAAAGLGLFWWRGGRLSRDLFKWKVCPRSLASKAARQGLNVLFHIFKFVVFPNWIIILIVFEV